MTSSSLMTPAENAIRLGLMVPYSGIVDMYGPEISWAGQIACAEINARGGLLGRPLQLIEVDDGSLPQTAEPAARRLIEEHGCVALIGNLLSSSRILVAHQVAEPACIPLLNFSFYEGSISSPYFFSFAALPNQQIDQMIPLMAKRYGPKMFFAGHNYEWPRGSIDAAKRALARSNGSIVGESYLPVGASAAEIDRLLGEVARSGADVFVPYFAGIDQVHLLTRFTELGLKPRIGVVMGHFDEVMASRLPPQVREGFYSCNTYFMTVDTPTAKRYLEQLAARPDVNGLWPHGNGMLTNFGEGVYVCVHAFAQAVQRAGTTESQALVAALERVSIEAPQGQVKMDAVSHHAHVNTYLTRCNAEGEFTIVEQFGCQAPVIPERYRHVHPDSNAAPAVRPAPHKVLPPLVDMASVGQILLHADTAVLATDETGRINSANRKAADMFGYTLDELTGMQVDQLLPPHLRHQHANYIRQFVHSHDATLSMMGRKDLSGYRKDGTFFPLEISVAKITLDGNIALVATLNDVTERKRIEDELLWRASHDGLTGLPNRALMLERLHHALDRSRRQSIALALLFLDLDNFKLVNDVHGHQVGDAVLKAVAEQLMSLVRPGDTVSRFAGDEFVILCENVEDPARIASVVERIVDGFRHPMHIEDVAIYITASIGVAIGHGGLNNADDLLSSADTAMYAAKQKGRDGWQFYSEALQNEVRQRLSISMGLRHALERNELSPRFQPIVDTDTRRVVGAEFLLRWHPPSGEVSPAQFIPIAEMTGAIVPIGRWVLQQGCLMLARWQQRWGAATPYLSMNLSVRQLDAPSLLEDFKQALLVSGADPCGIVLEITETTLMSDVDAHQHLLNQLVAMGVRIAVDDFGTGYSSLALLTRLPVGVLKIDRSFVSNCDTQAENRVVMRAVVGLGKAMGLQLVAEGVETESQHQFLRELECESLQGYFFYRPMLPIAFEDMLQTEIDTYSSR